MEGRKPDAGGSGAAPAGEMQDSQAALQLLLQELETPVLFLDRELRFLDCSSGFQRQLAGGGRPEAATPLARLLPDLEGTSLQLAAQEALQSGVASQLPPTISNRFMDTRLQPWSGGLLLIFEDVSGRRQLEQIRWELVDGLVHSFQTPLTSIYGFTEILLRDEELDSETRRDFTGRIQAQAQALTSLVGNLLHLSRLERRPQAPRDPLDLRHVAMESLRSVMHAAESQGMELGFAAGERELLVRGDFRDLHTAIYNLLDNAIKYSHYGGSVSLVLESLGSEHAVVVTDNGMGIEPEIRERIFERLFRGDSARRGDYRGSGLGLSLVQEIARLHGGRIELESRPGEGSRFMLILPGDG
ncbi:MAG: HAMP domain-containing sensor histidine kinase [bacterium]